MQAIIALTLMCLSLPVMAGSVLGRADYCFSDAAKQTGMNRGLLIAIAMGESDLRPMAINKNTDGTEDLGVMQINSTHFDFLRSVGIQRKDLFNVCVNIHVGALILKDCVRIHGNTWAAVGAYNVGHKRGKLEDKKRRRYAHKVWVKYMQLKRRGLA